MPTPTPDDAVLEVLLACARTALCDERRARLKALLRPPLDGHRLLRLGLSHGLTALLHHHLSTASLREELPQTILRVLERQASLVHRRNLATTSALVEVVDRFEGEAMPVLAFKGPTLALQAYGSLGLRPFNDLDVLVRPPTSYGLAPCSPRSASM